MPKFTEVPVMYSSVQWDQHFIAQIKKPGYHQDGKCYTGCFLPNTNIFRTDNDVRFYLEEIEKLWLINNYEFPQSVNFCDAVTSGAFRFTSPDLKKTPLKYYIVNNQKHNDFLSLYLVIPVKVLKAVAAAGISLEGYKVQSEWGKPFPSNDNKYRYDLVVNVPVRAESDIYSVNVNYACSKLMMRATQYFLQIDGYLQLLNNTKPYMKLHITIKDGDLTGGTILGGRGYFTIKPDPKAPKCGRIIGLYLPTEQDGTLAKDLRNPNLALFQKSLNEKWGELIQFCYNGYQSPEMRTAYAAYYHKSGVIDDEVLKFILDIEKKILEHQVESTVVITHEEGLAVYGVFLNGDCHFQAIPAKQLRGMTSDFVTYQQGVSINSQNSWFVELFLPVGPDEYLKKELQQSNMLLGEELNQTWGNAVVAYLGQSRVWRKHTMFFYHKEEGYKEALVDYLYQIERLLQKCPGAETKIDGYKSVIHLEDF